MTVKIISGFCFIVEDIVGEQTDQLMKLQPPLICSK